MVSSKIGHAYSKVDPQALEARPPATADGYSDKVSILEQKKHYFLGTSHETSEFRTWLVIYLCTGCAAAEIVAGIAYGSVGESTLIDPIVYVLSFIIINAL
jgi:hypothetical protein